MTTWWWLRHGPTHEKCFVGWRDVPADLSDIAAIKRLRAYLPDTAGLVSSDLSRAIATADAVAGGGHQRLAHVPDLREFNFGDWDGMTFDQVAVHSPKTARAYWENPGNIAAPNGESWNQVAARVGAWVDKINAAGAHEHVIAVAHFGVIMTQIQKAGGLSAYDALAHEIDNLSVTQLHWDGAAWHTALINHIV